MALQTIPSKEATASQLFEYLIISGIPVEDSLKDQEEDLRSLVRAAKLPDPIFVRIRFLALPLWMFLRKTLSPRSGMRRKRDGVCSEFSSILRERIRRVSFP